MLNCKGPQILGIIAQNFYHGQFGGKDLYSPVKRLILLMEIIAFSSEYRVKHIITLCVESAGRFSIRVGDTHSKHSD